MKVLIQRVLDAQVIIESTIHSSIQKGYLIYVCFEEQDCESTLNKAVNKIISLRILEDSNLKMNLNINQTKQEILAVSQFTLSWTGVKGNRPSFEKSMHPTRAQQMYNKFLSALNSKLNTELKTGVFGADMKITSTNDGPVTFFLSF